MKAVIYSSIPFLFLLYIGITGCQTELPTPQHETHHESVGDGGTLEKENLLEPNVKDEPSQTEGPNREKTVTEEPNREEEVTKDKQALDVYYDPREAAPKEKGPVPESSIEDDQPKEQPSKEVKPKACSAPGLSATWKCPASAVCVISIAAGNGGPGNFTTGCLDCKTGESGCACAKRHNITYCQQDCSAGQRGVECSEQ